VTQANAERLLSSWVPYWDLDRKVLIEKTPQNLLQARFLQALYPGSRFLIVMRHPIAVGYATQKWTTRIPALRRLGLADRRMPKIWIHKLIEHWLVCHERFERDRPYLREVHVLHYEDFVARPTENLRALHTFLGLPPAPLEREVRADVNDAYLVRWLGRRRSPVTRLYANRTIRTLEERVRRFGYSLVDGSAT
jgi:hypothetical protein